MPTDYFRRLEPGELFTAGAPLEVDLGCGDGSFLLAMARQHPERNFLGVERLLGRVRKVCRKVGRLELRNVKVLRLDARYSVEWLLPEHSVTRLHLLFPDPWPKARHHKRRLLNQPFLDALATVLVPGGELLFKTDHANYFEWAVEQVDTSPHFTITDWPPDAFFYPRTDFEEQWRGEGREIFRLRAVND